MGATKVTEKLKAAAAQRHTNLEGATNGRPGDPKPWCFTDGRLPYRLRAEKNLHNFHGFFGVQRSVVNLDSAS